MTTNLSHTDTLKEQEIAESIQSMARRFALPVRPDCQALVNQLALEQDYAIENPEVLHFALERPYEVALDAFIAQQLPSTMSVKNQQEYFFICRHYAFIADQIKQLVIQFEGMSCSTDKSRWLIGAYLQQLKGEALLSFPYKRRYHHPAVGQVEDWMSFIEACRLLYSGRPTKYLVAYQTLLMQYQSGVVAAGDPS